MWRALIIGDVHWRAENPIGRIDSYQAALTEKLRECWQIAKRNEVDAIIQTGDLFDSPDIAQTTMDDLWDILEEAPAPIFTVPGNHDLYGSNPETLYRTPLGHLVRRRVVKNAATGVFEERIGLHFVLMTGNGYDFSTDIDKSQYSVPMQAIEGYAPSWTRIHITHGMLLDGPPPTENMRWTSLEEAAALPNAPDVLINGHDHQGFGIRRVGRTLFINPGALCRIKADLREIDRPVQVALLEIPGQGEPRAELIRLESARPGAKVLSRDHLIAEIERQNRRAEFTDRLSAEMQEALDVTAMVDEIARAEGVDEAVRQGALRRISAAMEELAGRAA